MVSVRAYGELRRTLGSELAVELRDGAKLKDLVIKLKTRIGSSEEAFLGSYKLEDSSLVVLVNGRNIRALDGVNTPLQDGDHITLMPILIGG